MAAKHPRRAASLPRRSNEPVAQAGLPQRPLEESGTLVEPKRTGHAPAAILAQCESALLAHLRAACLWPDRQRNRTWRIGDYALYVLDFSPAVGSEAYLQFWSEPDEDGVIVHVSWGGRRWRGNKKGGARRREQLLERGFEAGSNAGNFRKIVAARNAKDLRAVVREAVAILCEVLGYDGRVPLTFRLNLGTRLRREPVFDAISPGDLAKLMRRWGFAAEVDHHDDDHNLITSSVGDQPFFIAFVGEHPEGSHEYGMVELRTYFAFEGGMPEGLSNAINQNFVTVKASLDEEGDLIVQDAILLHGGVTEASLALSFGIWKQTIEEILKGLELA